MHNVVLHGCLPTYLHTYNGNHPSIFAY